jgi:hypothetical protein
MPTDLEACGGRFCPKPFLPVLGAARPATFPRIVPAGIAIPVLSFLTLFTVGFYNNWPANKTVLRGPHLRHAGSESEALVPVHMELKRIIISEIHDQQVIMLKEVEGERSFPIVIGIFEATSIDRRVTGMPSPRPLTHDLVAGVIDHLGGELQDIFISDLRDHTYYAKLRIRQNGELVEVDCRPSDAIALAVTAKVPIYVAEDVLGEVCGE